MFKKMESKKKKTDHRWLMFVSLNIFVCVFLSVCVVDANDEVNEESLLSNEEAIPESLIDKEIDNIDNPKETSNYAGYILGRVVDSLTTLSYKSFSPYNDNKDLARMYSVVDKGNRTLNLYGNNSMWDGLFRACGAKTSLTCVKRNVFEYLNQSIETDGDFPVTDSILFTRNDNEPLENKYGIRLNNVSHQHTTRSISDSEPLEERSFSSFSSLTDVLYDKGVSFIKTHDLVLQLPKMLFDGAVVRISPKSLEEDGGAMFKVELNQERDRSGEGRILFKKQKKKLMMAFFAILLVVKMIKVKLMFILPLLLGVGTAKKMFLKLLLFIFPAFAQIFKFCAYYHAAHTKFHHHHHQIAHHHHHVPVPVPVHVDHSHTVHVEQQPYPPSHYGSSSWDSSGPDYISSRSEYLSPTQENELESWGLMSKGAFHVPAVALGSPSQSLAYNAYTQFMDDQRVSRSAQHVTEPTSFILPPKQPTAAKFDPNIISPPQYQQPPYVNNQQQQQQYLQKQQQLLLLQQNRKQQSVNNGATHGIHQQPVIQVPDTNTANGNKESTVQAKLLQQQQQKQLLFEQQRYQELVRQQEETLKLKALTPRPPSESTTVHVTYDPFYSPILQKMDNVFVQVGFNEEACRERLVCSMYKTPSRFSPYSNLISSELSRDPHELLKPAVHNSASVRFHRYLQAARDGQDQKDCLKLYPACTVRTE